MRPREWRAVHKKHHAHPDVEGDPHSPVLFGFWMVFLLTAYLYKYELNRAGEEIERYLKQTPPDKLDRIVLDHGMAGPWVILPILQISGLYLVFGHALWGHHSNLIFVVWIVGLGFFLMGGGYINAIGHTARVASLNPRVGYSRNITLFPWVFRLIKVAWGEELHKNHHEHEGSAKFSPYWWEDPGFCILIFLQLIGQASDIHVAKEMQRPIRS